MRALRQPALSVVALCAAVALASACGSGPVNEEPAKNDIEDKEYKKLAACRGSATDTQVDQNLEIATSFKESAHEMIVCGGLVVSLAGAVIEVMVDAALGGGKDTSALSFDGQGTYVASQMDVRIYLGEDTTFGKAGNLVTFDLRKLDSYFLDAKLVTSTSGGKLSAELEFSGTGPGVELLGLGPAPTSPITNVDLDAVSKTLGQLRLEASIRVKDEQAHAKVNYDLLLPKTALSSIVGGRQDYHLVSMSATRADLGQSLAAREFTVAFEDVGDHALDGTILADVTGGKFPFKVLYSYPKRPEPDVVIGCRNDTLSAPSGP